MSVEQIKAFEDAGSDLAKLPPMPFQSFLHTKGLISTDECAIINQNVLDDQKMMSTIVIIKRKTGSWELVGEFLTSNSYTGLAKKLGFARNSSSDTEELADPVLEASRNRKNRIALKPSKRVKHWYNYIVGYVPWLVAAISLVLNIILYIRWNHCSQNSPTVDLFCPNVSLSPPRDSADGYQVHIEHSRTKHELPDLQSIGSPTRGPPPRILGTPKGSTLNTLLSHNASIMNNLEGKSGSSVSTSAATGEQLEIHTANHVTQAVSVPSPFAPPLVSLTKTYRNADKSSISVNANTDSNDNQMISSDVGQPETPLYSANVPQAAIKFFTTATESYVTASETGTELAYSTRPTITGVLHQFMGENTHSFNSMTGSHREPHKSSAGLYKHLTSSGSANTMLSATTTLIGDSDVKKLYPTTRWGPLAGVTLVANNSAGYKIVELSPHEFLLQGSSADHKPILYKQSIGDGIRVVFTPQPPNFNASSILFNRFGILSLLVISFDGYYYNLNGITYLINDKWIFYPLRGEILSSKAFMLTQDKSLLYVLSGSDYRTSVTFVAALRLREDVYVIDRRYTADLERSGDLLYRLPKVTIVGAIAIHSDIYIFFTTRYRNSNSANSHLAVIGTQTSTSPDPIKSRIDLESSSVFGASSSINIHQRGGAIIAVGYGFVKEFVSLSPTYPPDWHDLYEFQPSFARLSDATGSTVTENGDVIIFWTHNGDVGMQRICTWVYSMTCLPV